MKSILIADAHGIVRNGVAQVLEAGLGGHRIAQCADAQSLFQLAGNATYDLFVIDIKLPDRGGFEILQDLRRLWPDTPVLMISSLSGAAHTIRARKLGAKALVHKSRLMEELVPTAQKLLHDSANLPPQHLHPVCRKNAYIAPPEV